MRGQHVFARGIQTRFFLTTVLMCGCLLGEWRMRGAAPAPFKVIHSFAGGANDGAMPTEGTSLAAAGSTLYGVTQSGGTSTNGVLFKINNNGSGFALVHVFNGYTVFLNPGGSRNDGATPTGTPVVSGSTLYGMTTQGGSNGFGTVYRVNTDGSGFQVLHSFGALYDGSAPRGSLLLSGSTLYGMTASGGSNFAQGVVFRIETSGEGYRILHNFRPGVNNDGGDALGSLVLSGSNLFGMTRFAGSGGQGMMFTLNTNGGAYNVLHQFTGTTFDGALPYGSLIIDGSTLYGMTAAGGLNNVGTVFKVNTLGVGFQILHNFAVSEGWQPFGDVTLVGSNLYGMTHAGGPGGLGAGVLFQLGTNGTGYQVLHTFQVTLSANNGAIPFGSLLFANGALFGMTSLGGGLKNQGCVFSYSIGGGTGTGSAEFGGSFSNLKEICKTKKGVLSCTFRALLTIQNTGTATSIPTHLRYFLSSDSSFDASVDVQIGEKTLPKIKASKLKKLRVKAKTTASTEGTYLLAVDDTGTVVGSILIDVP